MRLALPLVAVVLAAASPAAAQPVLFDFDSAPVHTSLPQDLTAGGITAHLSATGQGFSIQPADTMGFTPVGFSGLCVYPNSVFAADLLVSFSQPLNAFSILYADQELATDSSATMQVRAYMGTNLIGSATKAAPVQGTWPSATLAISTAQPFDNVVVHYLSPPPTGGDYGVIFMADNMLLTPAPIPEPSALALTSVGFGLGVVRKLRTLLRSVAKLSA